MIAELRDWLYGPVMEWAPRLTLVFLLAFRPWSQKESPGGFSYFSSKAYLGLLILGLLLQKLSLASGYWFLLAALHFLWLTSAYSVADNHRYLEGYWILSIAIALGFGGAEASRYLQLDARLLIGLCFLLAVFWKISSPRYRDGSFFAHSLLLETRFLPLALWLGGLRPDVQNRHQQARRKVIGGESDLEQAPVPNRLRRSAIFLAWWTITIESLVALLFILPIPNLDLWRVLALSLFIATVYVWVPVPTFGYALLLLLLATVQGPDLRLLVLGLVFALMLISGLALVFRAVALRKMSALHREASIPRFAWTARAKPHRLEDSGKLIFPALGISLYVKRAWFEALGLWLNREDAITWEELGKIASGIPESELKELVAMMTQCRILDCSKPLHTN